MSKVKTKSGRTVHMPTAEEDARASLGAAADADNPELAPEFFKRAKPASEALGAETAGKLVAMKRPRGRPAGSLAERRKVAVSMRFDPDVLDAMRSSGLGWQTRVNDLLRREFLGRR